MGVAQIVGADAGEALTRVVFLGNSAGYSPRFLEALARRSADPSDPVALTAVVSPQHFRSRRDVWRFGAKRHTARVLDTRVGTRVTSRLLRSRGEGFVGEMQRLARIGGAPILWPRSERDQGVRDFVAGLGADVCVVAGLNRIVKEPVFSSFPPIYNIHPSVLPAFRGANPEFWQLALGSTEGGATLHRLDPGVDTGPIVLQERFAIQPWFDIAVLEDLSIGAGVDLLNRFLDNYPQVAADPIEQGEGTYQPLPTPADRIAPFGAAAHVVFDRARAFGWSSPLVIHVRADDWDRGEPTNAVDQGIGTVALRAFDPVPFDGESPDPPGTVRRVGAHGVTLACTPGTILFRRVELARE